MYSAIRLFIGWMMIIASILIINLSKIGRKKLLNTIFISLSIAVMIVLNFLPFENLFITFNSPDEAFGYYYRGKISVDLVVEGDNCDLVIDREDVTDRILIVPKTSDGWKAGIGTDIRRVHDSFRDSVTITVYQYKNTNDYFISIFNFVDGKVEVSDNCGTEFSFLENKIEKTGEIYVKYFGHISNFDDDYTVVVNGKVISLKDR